MKFIQCGGTRIAARAAYWPLETRKDKEPWMLAFFGKDVVCTDWDSADVLGMSPTSLKIFEDCLRFAALGFVNLEVLKSWDGHEFEEFEDF